MFSFYAKAWATDAQPAAKKARTETPASDNDDTITQPKPKPAPAMPAAPASPATKAATTSGHPKRQALFKRLMREFKEDRPEMKAEKWCTFNEKTGGVTCSICIEKKLKNPYTMAKGMPPAAAAVGAAAAAGMVPQVVQKPALVDDDLVADWLDAVPTIWPFCQRTLLKLRRGSLFRM